jgi:hypothetical protein
MRRLVKGQPMQEHAYRVFEISEDGHVQNRRDLYNCLSDEDAKRSAMRMVDGHILELCDGACLLERFEPRH